MGMEARKQVIDGMDVRCTPLPVIRQYNLMTRLFKLLAPLGVDLDKIMAQDVSVLAPVFAALDREGEALLLEVVACTAVVVPGPRGGQPQLRELDSTEAINGVLTGKLPTLLKIAKFSLEVNYGGFFAGAASGGAKTDDEPPSPKASPSR